MDASDLQEIKICNNKRLKLNIKKLKDLYIFGFLKNIISILNVKIIMRKLGYHFLNTIFNHQLKNQYLDPNNNDIKINNNTIRFLKQYENCITIGVY
jgi:hypothetical protein